MATTQSGEQYSAEERTILARFATRTRRAAQNAVETISHGTFIIV